MNEASTQDGTYPRPQLVRGSHLALDVMAGFAYDDGNVGLRENWHERADVFDRLIQLPFAPESPASGIGDTAHHPVVWYRISFDDDDLAAAGRHRQGDRVLLHFGAVDHSADVWVNGIHVVHHEGGQTPFSADITEALAGTNHHVAIVRAEDDPLDATMPRGKQDWMAEPHVIWYHRQTGIWRTVWLEAVPELHIVDIDWECNATRDTVRLDVTLSRRPVEPVDIDVRLSFAGSQLVRHRFSAGAVRSSVSIPLPSQANAQDAGRLEWSPAQPHLVDAVIALHSTVSADTVASYLGIRSIGIADGRFLLNDRPTYIRSVLEQGYWPTSHYTPPSMAAIRSEVELMLALGFNAVRIHQKVEDPRFLYWCDRLGLMVWGETANAYEFGPTAIRRLTTEWPAIIDRDRSHPSIVTWVPLNESWGAQHGAHDAAQRAYGLALANLTRAMDPSRPVISNDGWEHTDSDLWTIHDYEADGDVLRSRYGDRGAIDEMIGGMGPAGRRMSLLPVEDFGKPVMLTEFGGVSYDPSAKPDDSWGYSVAADAGDFARRLTAILEAVNGSRHLAGFCYTQLTDTRQETNGLCDEDRRPKLDLATLAALIRGE